MVRPMRAAIVKVSYVFGGGVEAYIRYSQQNIP